MDQLDPTGGFDVHEYRHALKLLTQDRETMHLLNREELACPACGRPFEKLMVSEKRMHTFRSPPGPFCLVRTDEQVLMLTH